MISDIFWPNITKCYVSFGPHKSRMRSLGLVLAIASKSKVSHGGRLLSISETNKLPTLHPSITHPPLLVCVGPACWPHLLFSQKLNSSTPLMKKNMRNAAPCSHRHGQKLRSKSSGGRASNLLSLAVLKGTDHAQDHEIQCLLCCPPLTVNLYKMSGTR